MPTETSRFVFYAVSIFMLSFVGGIVPLLRRWTHSELQLLISFSAGIILGVVFVEWPTAIREGLTPSSGPYGAVFFMMTGMHAFHVVTGLIFLAVVYLNARKGLYDQKNYPIEAAAVYWHFVDLVWIFYYPALYLIGTLVLV